MNEAENATAESRRQSHIALGKLFLVVSALGGLVALGIDEKRASPAVFIEKQALEQVNAANFTPEKNSVTVTVDFAAVAVAAKKEAASLSCIRNMEFGLSGISAVVGTVLLVGGRKRKEPAPV